MTKKEYRNKYDLSSGLFSILEQPDSYWVFSGLIEAIEETENERYEETKHYREPDGNWYLKSEYASDQLSRAWFTAFEQIVTDKFPRLNMKYKGFSRPKCYNYGGDSGNFSLFCNRKEYDRICKLAMSEGKRFEKFLQKTYSSYDGFISFYPDNLQGYINAFNNDYEKALVIAISFLCFGQPEIDQESGSVFTDDTVEAFDSLFEGYVDDISWYDADSSWYFEPEYKRDETCALCGETHADCHSIGYGKYACEKCATELLSYSPEYECYECEKILSGKTESVCGGLDKWVYKVAPNTYVCRECFEEYHGKQWEKEIEQVESLFEGSVV